MKMKGHKHTGKTHVGHHMKSKKKDSLAHASHATQNKAHGTPKGFATEFGDESMGEAKGSHLGTNAKNC